MEGVLYCKPHFEQLFKEHGNFSKNFQSPATTSSPNSHHITSTTLQTHILPFIKPTKSTSSLRHGITQPLTRNPTSSVIYASLLQTCVKTSSFYHGTSVHAHVLKSGLHSDRFVGNSHYSHHLACTASSLFHLNRSTIHHHRLHPISQPLPFRCYPSPSKPSLTASQSRFHLVLKGADNIYQEKLHCLVLEQFHDSFLKKLNESHIQIQSIFSTHRISSYQERFYFHHY